MKARLSLFSLLLAVSVAPAFAGWEYDGYYVDDAYYEEDDVQFIVGLRGGFSWGNAKIKNEIGNLYGYYYIDTSTNDVISESAWTALEEPPGYVPAGYGDLSTLKPKEDYSRFSFTAGASVGFTIPYHPHWRLEAGYDHIAETNYNQIPLFEGDLQLSSGIVVNVASCGAAATISTDVISAMAYYDFFDGNMKQLSKVIPYIGVGVGYATSKTTLKLSDIYGDLYTDSNLRDYGEINNGVLQFDPPTDKSKYPSSDNIAVIGALGVSYGIAEYTFLDFGARVMYIPKVTWQLVNSDGTKHRDWFSAEHMLYTNITLGLRFEF